MDYTFNDFKWLATNDGFNYPSDVYYGTIYIGTLIAKPDGFVIKLIDTPIGKQFINKSSRNKFKSQIQAAGVLHKTWKMVRNNNN